MSNSEFDNQNSAFEDVVASQEQDDVNTAKKRPLVPLVIFNVVVGILLAASLVFTGILGGLAYVFQDMQLVVDFPEPDDHENLGIDTEVIEQLPTSGITNIALFGIDSHNKTTSNNATISGRSDSIIILTINENNNTVKLTSILRDSWVPVENRGYNKINSAYAFGGAKLAIKTINQNFGLDIADYASVSLQQLVKVIDYIGGIDMYVTEAERKQICITTISEKKVTPLEKSGNVHLAGDQAVAYARIRKIDGDDKRAQRHQKVLTAMLAQVRTLPISEYPTLLKNILGDVETSMSYDEIMSFLPVITAGSLTVERTNIPGGEVKYTCGIFSDTRGGWVWKYDLQKATDYIHDWIYGNENEDNNNTDN